MKTLNKTLSLVLALVMVFSLFGVASAAKLDDFTDKGDVTYTEAVDYLTAASIVAGNTATTINPKGDFTREQAAKLVAYAALGQAAADAMKTGTAPFTDVAADRWSAGYIAYCVNAGIINGTGDGTFAPEAKVTGYQMAKMLLGALGYGVKDEFVGPNWKLEVAKYALAKDIFYGNTAGASDVAANREEAFLYTFNALTRAMLVKYNDSLNVYYSGTNPFETVSGTTTGETIGYQRFKMAKVTADGTYAEPAHYWAIDGKSVTDTYPDDDIRVLATSTAGTPYENLTTKGRAEYIGYSAETTVVYYLNGDKSDKDAVSAAAAYKGNEIKFMDTDKDGKYDTVEALVYHVAKLSAAPTIRVNGSVNSVTIADIAGLTNKADSAIKGEYKDLKKDDYVLYYKNKDNTTFHIFKCETLTGQLFGFNAQAGKVNVNGTEYNVSQISKNSTTPDADFTAVWKNITETAGLAGTVFYFDAGKNICAAEPTEDVVAAANVVFVLNNTQPMSVVTAELLKSDGTVMTKQVSKVLDTTGSSVTVNTTSVTKNEFFTFTENKDGTVTLKQIANAQGTPKVAHELKDDAYATAGNKVFTRGTAKFWTLSGSTAGSTTGTNTSVFVLENEGSKAGTYTAYTGISNIPNVTDAGAGTRAYVLNDADGYAIMGVVLGGKLDTTVANLGYAFLGMDGSRVYTDATDRNKYTLSFPNSVVDGEIKNLEATSDFVVPSTPTIVAIDGYEDGKADHYIASPSNPFDPDTDWYKTRANNSINVITAIGAAQNKTASTSKFEVKGNTVSYTLDASVGGFSGMPTYTENSFVVDKDAKVFVFDTYEKAAGKVDLYASTIDALTSLPGDHFALAALRVSDKNDTINELYVVILPKTGTGGTSGVTSGAVASGEYTATANAIGKVVINFSDIARGSFVPASAKLTVNAEVYINGAYVGDIEGLVDSGANDFAASNTTHRVITGDINAVPSDTITLKNVTYTTNKVSVVYLDKNGKNISANMVADATYTDTIATVGTTTAVKFQVNTTATDSDKNYEIYQLNAKNEKVVLGTKAFGTDTTTAQTSDALSADVAGTSAVYVKVDFAMSDLTETFSITKDSGLSAEEKSAIGIGSSDSATGQAINKINTGLTTASSDTLKIEFAMDDTIAAGTDVAVKATVAGKANNYGYFVTVKTDAGDIVFDLISDGNATKYLTVNKNVKITDVVVTARPLMKLVEASIAWSTANNTVTLTFTNDVDTTTGENIANYTFTDAAGSIVAIKDATVSGKTVTFTFANGAIAADDTLAVSTSVLDKDYAGNTAASETATLVSGGTATVA